MSSGDLPEGAACEGIVRLPGWNAKSELSGGVMTGTSGIAFGLSSTMPASSCA
jgi:hypothetical protein